MGNSSSSSGDDDGRGSEGSGSVPQDQAPREDEADGDSDIHEEEDEEQDHDRSDVPDEERGFNMVFSPELVRRLQGEPEPGEDDDGTPGTAGSSGSPATQNNLAEAGIAAQLAEAERVERERREAERRHFAALSRQEKVAAAELEGILRSIPSEADLAAAREQQQEQQRQKRGRHVPPPSFEGPCAEEQAACMECIRAEGSIPECQDVINKFEACAARR